MNYWYNKKQHYLLDCCAYDEEGKSPQLVLITHQGLGFVSPPHSIIQQDGTPCVERSRPFTWLNTSVWSPARRHSPLSGQLWSSAELGAVNLSTWELRGQREGGYGCGWVESRGAYSLSISRAVVSCGAHVRFVSRAKFLELVDHAANASYCFGWHISEFQVPTWINSPSIKKKIPMNCYIARHTAIRYLPENICCGSLSLCERRKL